jgi:hypothetical protein
VCEKSEHVGVNAVSVWSCSFLRCFFCMARMVWCLWRYICWGLVQRERLGVFIVWYVNLCGIFSWLIVGMGWDAYTFR